jgi:hypothetical protein
VSTDKAFWSRAKRAARPGRREGAIERAFVKRIEAAGGLALKLNVAGHVGWPDRLVLMPNAIPLLVEFKDPEGELSPVQEHRITELKALGYDVHVFDNADWAFSFVETYGMAARTKLKEIRRG